MNFYKYITVDVFFTGNCGGFPSWTEIRFYKIKYDINDKIRKQYVYINFDIKGIYFQFFNRLYDITWFWAVYAY